MLKIPVVDTIAVDHVEHENIALSAKRTLSNRAHYAPSNNKVRYTDAEKNIALNLALSCFGELAHTPVDSCDENFYPDSCTSVYRYKLTNGTIGYFKPFSENSCSEDQFRDYGTSSLNAAVNEVNAYRLSQLMGGGFADLVPETRFREIDGKIGTIQREVLSIVSGDGRRKYSYSKKFKYSKNPQLKRDYRKAAIFDFVIGNLDRHSDNFIYSFDDVDGKKRPRIKLIDNSFSFPHGKNFFFNQSVFADNRAPSLYSDDSYSVPLHKMSLKSNEREGLKRAQIGVADWIKAKTIGVRRGQAALKRINSMLEANRLISIGEYLNDY